MVVRPRSASSSLTSRPTVSMPACTQTCAIPAPIVPRPTTPTRSMDGIEPPFSRHALEGVRPAVVELDAGAGDQVLHCLGDEHLARARQPGDPRAGRDRDSRRLPSDRRALARVDPGAHLEIEARERVADCAGAVDG